MNLTIMVKLNPTSEQHTALLQTMERFNSACNVIAEIASREHTANKVKLQQFVYHQIRADFGLSSQLTIRAIAKVCEAYKRDLSKQPSFRSTGAIVYDQRILSWKALDRVSILTVTGRILVNAIIGGYQAARLTRMRGQADLLYRDGIFYLAVIVDVPEPTTEDPHNWLGVDLGIVNIAADSDGEQYAGAQLNGLRARHARLRRKLQAKGTKSAKHLLKRRRRKEQRFARDVNHCLSKKLVAKAKDSGRGIALEDLKGIRARITVRKAQRRVQHGWGFFQLRSFIEYKSVLSSVLVRLIDPRYSSQQCPRCGHVDKRNRPSQAKFLCIRCSFAGPADTVAALNLKFRAGCVVSAPHVSGYIA
jgi:putative transposase